MTSFLKQHRKLCIFIAVIIVIAVAAAIAIPRLTASNSSPSGIQKQSTVELSKMTLTSSISATGTLESNKSKTVTANVSNITVKKVYVSVGDTVEKGETLISFDESDLQDALADAQDNLSDAQSDASRSLASAQKKLTEAKETYSDDKASLAKAVKEAKEDRDAAKKQVAKLKKQLAAAKDANTKAQLTEKLTSAREALSQAKEAYENAVSNQTSTNKQNQSSIDSAQETLESTESSNAKTIKEAKSQVTEAQSNLDDCEVTAPISGTVTSISVEAGDTYSGDTIMQIEDISSFTVTASIDEYDISSVETGQRVVILTDATDDEELEGEITFVAPSTESSQSSQSQTGTTSTSSSGGYEVTIQVNSTNENLKLGMTAKCSIILEEAADVFAVPYDAVHTNRDGTKVIYVVDEDSSSSDNSSSDSEAGNDSSETNSEAESDSSAASDARSSASDTSATLAQKEITVTTGMETDYYIEISGSDLEEGLRVIIPTDETEASSSDDSDDSDSSSAFSFGTDMGGGNMGGGNMGGGGKGGNMGGGGGPQ